MEENYQEYLKACEESALEPVSEEVWNKDKSGEETEIEELFSIADTIKNEIEDLDVVDYDITWPEAIDEENSVIIKIVHNQDGDEVEKLIYMKLVVDEKAMELNETEVE